MLAGCGGSAGGGDLGVEVPWAVAKPGEGRTLRIGYHSDPCTRARKAVVGEDGREVVVTLYDDEKDADKVCIQIARPGCVTVELEDPLGGRRVVDGARDDTRGEQPSLERFGPCRPIPSR